MFFLLVEAVPCTSIFLTSCPQYKSGFSWGDWQTERERLVLSCLKPRTKLWRSMFIDKKWKRLFRLSSSSPSLLRFLKRSKRMDAKPSKTGTVWVKQLHGMWCFPPRLCLTPVCDLSIHQLWCSARVSVLRTIAVHIASFGLGVQLWSCGLHSGRRSGIAERK